MTNDEVKAFSEKVTHGVNLAVKRLIEKTKQEDGELVISRDGKVVRVKARSLK